MVVIERNIITDPKRKPNLPMAPMSICIHETGNTNVNANADMHTKYLKIVDKSVCWHYTVDDHIAIQHLENNEQGWHVGSKEGNRESIGIEICVNRDGDFDQALQNAAELVSSLINLYGWIPVVQHHDYTRSNGTKKNCPRTLRATPNGWLNFFRRVQNCQLQPK